MKKIKNFFAVMMAMVLFVGILPVLTPGALAATIEGDYEYVLLGGQVTITRYHGDGGNLVIPGIIAGFPVTAIGNRAFYRKGLTSVTIPDSVTHIRFQAFQDNGIVAVSVGLGIAHIDYNVFHDNPPFVVHAYQDSYAHRWFRENRGNSQFNLKPLPTYAVTFMDRTDVISRQNIRHGFNASSPAAPRRTGFVFLGWDRAFSNITAPITVNARWQVATYTVMFRSQNRTIVTRTVQHGRNATAPRNPTRTGYTFRGWDRSFNNVTGNIVVNARWRANTIRLTFNANGGRFSRDRRTVFVNNTFDKRIKLAATPRRNGHTFAGWFTARTGGRQITARSKVPAVNTTYHARWVRRR